MPHPRPTRLMTLRNAVLASAAAALSLVPSLAGAQPSPQRQPNVVVIMADDLGWKDLSVQGSTYFETPNIDRLAQQGIRFTDAYANAPVCAPTRACLWTGLYGPRHGVYTVWKSERGKPEDRKIIPIPNNPRLGGDFVTLAEEFKAAGYATGHVGKWHLGKDPDADGPRAQGYDHNVAGSAAGGPKTYFSPWKMAVLTDGPKGEYLPDRMTTEAIKFIDANQDKPFFLDLSYYTPHNLPEGRLEAKPEKVEKYKAKPPGEGRQRNPEYAAMIESLDEGVGRVMAALDERGLAENTIVVFTSDNGGWGPATDALPLRGQKGELYDGGIRVPLIMRAPGRIQAGKVDSTPVLVFDINPTVLSLAGAKGTAAPTAAAPPPKDAVDLTPILTGGPGLARDAIFFHFPAYDNRWPDNTTVEGPWISTPCAAIRMGDWKLIEFFEDGRLELYNLKTDPGESNNLAESNPQKLQELHARMKRWREETNAPVPTEPNPLYKPAAS
jgi:arylsulfatase A-like enzyme